MVKGQQERPPRQLAVGGGLGVVVVRCGESHENDFDRLQKGLSPLSRSRPGNGLDLYGRVSSAQVGEGRAGSYESSTSSTIRSAERHHTRRRAKAGARPWATAGPRQRGRGGSLGRPHPRG